MRGGIFISDDGIHCVGRHGRHRGWRAAFGSGGGEFEGGGWGGLFRAGRMLAAGDIRRIVLVLLAEKSRHGYDIIKAVEERSHGFYGPSPGVVYPTLTYLEEIGYATCESEGTKKLYSITDAGREHLAQNREEADAVFEQLERIGRKMAHMRHWFDDETAETDDARDDLHAAQRNLRGALSEKTDAVPDEQRRIAEILNRAAAEIRGRK